MSAPSEPLPHDERKVNLSQVEVDALRQEAYDEGFDDAANAAVEEENEALRKLQADFDSYKEGERKKLDYFSTQVAQLNKLLDVSRADLRTANRKLQEAMHPEKNISIPEFQYILETDPGSQAPVSQEFSAVLKEMLAENGKISPIQGIGTGQTPDYGVVSKHPYYQGDTNKRLRTT